MDRIISFRTVIFVVTKIFLFYVVSIRTWLTLKFIHIIYIIAGKQNLTDQLQKLKSMYEISRPKDPEEYDDSAISSGEETKSQNSSFSDKSFLSNSFTDQDSEVSAARLKIRSALSRFARSSYKSENDENLSDAVSWYNSWIPYLHSFFSTLPVCNFIIFVPATFHPVAHLPQTRLTSSQLTKFPQLPNVLTNRMLAPSLLWFSGPL